jgi:hypothetical protein
MSSEENKKIKTPEVWTYSQIESKLNSEIRFGKEYNKKQREESTINEKYLKMADYWMHKIPLYQPTPVMEIDLQDLSVELRKQMANSPDDKIRVWMNKAVGAVFDEVNSTYYRASVHKLLRIKFGNTNESEQLVEQIDKDQVDVNKRLVKVMSPTEHNKTIVEKEHDDLIKYAIDYKSNKTDEEKKKLNDIDYIIDVITREAKGEHKLSKQILLTLFSTYTQNPINLAIKAQSGEGKSYVLGKITALFPAEDIYQITGMSEKSIFHQKGKNVYTNPVTGRDEDADDIIMNLKTSKSSIDRKLKKADENSEYDEVERLSIELRDINNEMDEIKHNVKKVIDLRHKIMIFLDTPPENILKAIMPLLSHDKDESEYHYVETNDNSGIKTKTNILRGWPTIIYCQAIDTSLGSRWEEIQRRFILVNPRTDKEKYKQAIKHTGKKYGMSSLCYEEEVLSKKEKDIAKGMVLLLKEEILNISHDNEPGKRDCVIPYYESASEGMDSDKAKDMTMAERVFSFCQMLTLININRRPRMVSKDTRKDDEKQDEIKTPIATFEDLKMAMDLTELDSSGMSPEVYAWYCGVFLTAWFNKDENQDVKETRSGEIIKEDKKLLSATELAEATTKIEGKRTNAKNIRNNYIGALLSNQFIEEYASKLDGRAKKYYPLIIIKPRKVLQTTESQNSDRSNPNILYEKKLNVQNPILFPTKEHIIYKIQHEITLRENRSISAKVHNYKKEFNPLRPFDNGEEMALDDVAEMYFKDPSCCFEVGRKDAEKDLILADPENDSSYNNIEENDNNYNNNNESLDDFQQDTSFPQLNIAGSSLQEDKDPLKEELTDYKIDEVDK